MEFSNPPKDTAPINQIFTMMAMAQMQENGIETIDEDIERELSEMEARINIQESMD
jgi:predicted amino acid-binding ACT domain protein